MDNNEKLFKNKSLNDIFADIYDNSKKKDRQINLLIGELRPLIKNSGDATVIVPLIKEYLEVAVKNDDHLVKLAAIVQRLISANTKASVHGGGSNLLSEAEKKQLLETLDEVEHDIEVSQNEIDDVKEKADQVKDQLDEDGDVDE